MTSASALRLERTGDPAQFEKIAGAFLSRCEAENNLPLGLNANLKAGRTYGSDPPYVAVVRSDGAVVARRCARVSTSS
ncbi:MAG TPA: hypothetical protein VGK07_05520 [Candidatus Limnocylindria bacterium]